ncbi:dihydrolipoamide dehydrogenase [Candidatus Marinamargulisbacteria bacterium SCGC AAA071-K20]|nr:dihydrolipoamide dehydrogenase [Candidatus Marinamargulisbacteria bacterium SCGC AAA071-K20]
MTRIFDVIVIGSGGGSKITRPAAMLGKKVAIIEKGRLGGTCLNHGCIPSKMLIHVADLVSEVRETQRFELVVNQEIKVNFKALVDRVSATIDKDSDSIAPAYDKNPNVTLFEGEGRFIDNHTVEVNGERLTAKQIVIAAGARANIPDIKGLLDTPYWTYKEILRNTEQPKSLIVIGGGYIATELGYFYGALGTKIDFLVRNRMVKAEDKDIIDAFEKDFSDQFPVHFGHTPTEVNFDGKEFIVKTRTKEGDEAEFRAEKCLVATGFKPNSDILGLENTNVKTDDNGHILVDDYLRTDVPHIYAFGDILGRYLFRHSANFEGEYVFKTHFEGSSQGAIKYPPVPHAIFTHPQVGGVGKTEQECVAEGIDYFVGLNPYKSSAMGMALRSESGFVKLIFEKSSQKLIGAHIIGPEASNMIHMCIAYMNMGATLTNIIDTIYVHPALPELIRNAARKAFISLYS